MYDYVASGSRKCTASTALQPFYWTSVLLIIMGGGNASAHPKVLWQCLSCVETRLDCRRLPTSSENSRPCGNLCIVPTTCRPFECLNSLLVSVNASKLASHPRSSPLQPGDSVGSLSSAGKILKTSRLRSGLKWSEWKCLYLSFDHNTIINFCIPATST